MLIWDHIPDDLSEETALCIGKFDGFHKGHRLLISEAKKTGNPVCVLTFVFNKTETIDSREEKQRIADSLGVEYYVEIEADRSFFSMSPERFISDIVRAKLHARYVVVGEDFRFGKDRAGDIKTLDISSAEYGYELKALPKEKYGDEDISSSRIRECIAAGEMEAVTRMLGRPYSMSGIVTTGNHIGRRIGAPTANLVPEPGKVMPPFGVYAVDVYFSDKYSGEKNNEQTCYNGIANFGVKPTVGKDNPPGLEINIFDFDGDIYREKISVDMLYYIRPERRFDSLDELKAQIEKDIKEAGAIFSERQNI